MICHLKLVTMMLCENSSEKLKIVGFSCTKHVHKLLCFDSLLRSFLLARASTVHSKTSNDWHGKAGHLGLWAVTCG
jgi:hypothetical protein